MPFSVYPLFDQKLADPDRVRLAHAGRLGELMSVEFPDLSGAREKVKEALGEYIQGPFAKALERQVTASFDHLRAMGARIKALSAILGDAVHRQDEHLWRAVTMKPALPQGRYVLVAFSAVEDQTIDLGQREIESFIKAAAKRERQDESKTDEILRAARKRADSARNQKQGNLDDAVWDAIDMIAVILVLMRREGLKPFVADAHLQDWLIDYFRQNAGINGKTIGGAASNEARMLRALELPVLIHVPYNHTDQAWLTPEGVERLRFAENGSLAISSFADGDAGDPHRFSFVLQLASDSLKIGGQEYRPPRPDRIIFRIPNPRGEQPNVWNELRVSWSGDAGENWGTERSAVQRDAGNGVWYVSVKRDELRFLPNDWPQLPAFQHPYRLEGSTLQIQLASVEEMRAVAKLTQEALLGGIEGLGKTYYTPVLTELLRHVVTEQLSVLADEGIGLHLEFSSEMPGSQLSKLKDLFNRAQIRHLSLNREQLVQITSEAGSTFFVHPRSLVPETLLGLYLRAKRLLLNLDVETLYIHDIELDMLVRRDSGNETEDRRALERHRQAMSLAKASVPAVLIHRAGQPQDWTLALSTEALTALLGFAAEYAAVIAPADEKVRDAVQQAVVLEGFSYPGEAGVSVVIAPGIFVDMKVSLTGAGDFNFGAEAAASIQPRMNVSRP